MASNRTGFVPRSKCCRLLRSPGWGYLTPLHYACCSAKFGSVKFLLESQAGCDPNAIDAYGWTPLHWAARSGNRDIVTILLKHEASLDIEDSVRLTNNLLIFYTAILKNDFFFLI
jgi:ankyrin repeat protein